MCISTSRSIATILVYMVLGAFVVAKAQSPSNLRSTATPTSTEEPSSNAVAKQAANPLATMWLIQYQQNNNWVGMPLNHGNQVESSLQFQPLISLNLTENWNLDVRPVFRLFSSAPYLSSAQRERRVTGFGDTVFAFALSPSHAVVGNWLLAAGPTFVFPTATESKLGQSNWQGGPTAALGYTGEHFIAYIFPQQWFKIGGDGQTTKQLDAQYAFVYFLRDGWSVGTNPDVFVDWEAKPGNQVTFPMGLQIGKLRKLGPLPIKFDVQAEYYAIHPEVHGSKWGAQLQITPVIPSLIKNRIL
jgi:hypothetical protein